MRALLLERGDQFVGTVTEKLLAYALGRGPGILRPANRANHHPRGGDDRLPVVLYNRRHREEHPVHHAEGEAMIITKKAIPRRTVLRGLGASLALPLLDGMVPALEALQNTAARQVRRLGVVYIPNGIMMDHWTPATEGAGFDFPTILQPLESFRDSIQVLSGMDGVESPGAHARASTRFLTGVPANPDNGSDLKAGISMDQIAGRMAGRETQLASLELALDGRDFSGSLRRRIQLCVHEHHLVGERDHAASDGEQPAGRVRATLW